MSRADLAAQSCTIARAVETIGDPWTLMILREMFMGVRRFDEFQRQTGASPHILSKRLRRLEGIGAVLRTPYQDRPLRHEYRLTEMGRDLWPVIIALKGWGDRWFTDGPPPIDIRHKKCGHVCTPRLTCPHCGDPMGPRDSIVEPSPEICSERTVARS